ALGDEGLDELAGLIRASLGRARSSGREYAENARQTGAMLAAAKARFRREPREWERFVKERCDLRPRMAEYYIEFHELWAQIEPELDGKFAPGASFSIKGTLAAVRRRAGAPLPAPGAETPDTEGSPAASAPAESGEPAGRTNRKK